MQFIDLTGPVAQTVKVQSQWCSSARELTLITGSVKICMACFLCMLCHRYGIIGTLTELLKFETSKTLSFTPLFLRGKKCVVSLYCLLFSSGGKLSGLMRREKKG